MSELPGAHVTDPSGPLAESPEADRILRGLTPDVQPTARYLLNRLVRPAEASQDVAPPRPSSLEALCAAVGAVREVILDAGESLSPQRLRLLHGRLDGELERLLRQLFDRSRRESRALLRDVSHDLRSPLGSILFLADALAGEHSGELNEVQLRQVGVLFTAALSLEGLLNDLIDAAQIGELRAIESIREMFSLETVLDQVDQLCGPLAAQSGVELAFRLETLGPRVGDRRILTRVLLNLVANALRATPRGGRVEVRAFEERAAWLVLSVEDTGTDADLGEIRRLLTEAPLLESGNRDRGWTHGLGLSICARLVAAAEGRIDVESNGAGGCRFDLELPFGRE